MQKEWIWFSLVVALALSVSAATVDHAIDSQLQKNNDVPVIITLNDQPLLGVRAQSIAHEKEKIHDLQQNVLDDFAVSTQSTEKKEFVLKNRYSSLPMLSGKISKSALEKLKKNKFIERIELDKNYSIFLTGSSPQINATKVQGLVYNNTNVTGAGVTVCVIDTGIDYTHPAFGGCTQAQFTLGTCSKIIGGYDYQNNDNNPIDDHGHGTHVAGIVASENDTYRGIAYGAKLVALKVCDSGGSCSTSNMIAGMDWCKNNRTIFNISVATMSIGGSTFTDSCDSQADSNAANQLVGQGIFFSIAAGNDGSSTSIADPACASNATAVGSVTNSDSISSFSNRAPFMKLLAPGSSITSTVPYSGASTLVSSTGIQSASGTSMATPHVAGAAALLIQFKRLEKNQNLTPVQIEKALNSTGKNITDGSNVYVRINIFDALASLDTSPPNVTFVAPTPTNNTITFNKSITINITSIEVLHTGLLEWNGTNQTMNGAATNRFLVKSNLGLGLYQYKVFGNDSAGNVAVTGTQFVNISNNAPTVAPSLNTSDNLNRTNGTLLGIWTFSDGDGDTQQLNETKWYNNTLEITALRNLTSVSAGNTTKADNWTLGVRGFDGYVWSTWTNSTVLIIQNSAPVLGVISNTTINETDLFTANSSGEVNPTDNDNDVLVINYSSPLNASGQWKTTVNNGSTYSVWANATDGTATTSRNFVITVIDRPDFDNDGIIDLYDADDDGDGLSDTDDSIKGNFTHVTTTVPFFNLSVNGTFNLTQIFNKSYEVKIFNQTREYLRFNFSFNVSVLDLSNLTVEINNGTLGSFVISGISLGAGNTKTAFIDNTSRVNGVCIKDTPTIASVGNITGNCSAPYETFVRCPGTKSQYACIENGSRWMITGLNNSGIQQQNDTLPPKILTIGPSGTQATSDSSVGVTLTTTTDENATCRYSQTANINYSTMVFNLSFDAAWMAHTQLFSYTADDDNETFYVLCNDSIGNVMTITNTTLYAVDIGSGGGSGNTGGGGGGGGSAGGAGGGSVKKLPNKVQFFSEIHAHEKNEITIANDLLDLTKAIFFTNKDLKGVTVTLEKINDSQTIPLDDTYTYYQAKLDKFTDDDISAVTLSFRVNAQWISSGSYDENTVEMKKLFGSTWKPLPTKLTSKDSTYFYYDALSTSFSQFAVTAKKKEWEQQPKEIPVTPESKNNFTVPQQNSSESLPQLTPPQQTIWLFLAAGLAIISVLLFIFFKKKTSK